MQLRVISAFALATLASGAEIRQNVGIGLGTVIFEGKDGLISQVSAATTNGCFGNQTFAITTGTLGANPYNGIVGNVRANSFVKENLDVLAREMAAGQGESLVALADIIGVPAAQRTAWNHNLQQHFLTIFTSPTVTHTEVLANIAQVTG